LKGIQKQGNAPVPALNEVPVRPASKTALILASLRRPKGASLKELVTATGWQPHSIRGFLSAVVAGKMGLKVKSIKLKSADRRYSIRAGS
jgi:hypothetical protein